MAGSDLVREFLRKRDVLMGFIFALTLDHDLAEELFQEVAVSILTEAQKGVQPSDFMAWARALARHRVADHFRKQARHGGAELAFESMADVVDRSFAEHGPGAEECQTRLKFLLKCLEKLSARARGIVDARYREQKPLRDIAARLGWKEASVKVALAKARRALADCVTRKLRARESSMP